MTKSVDLQARLHYAFRNPELLRQALTHRSFGATHNERLEFLGDSVLNLIVATLLYADGQASEGKLSYWRASLVREATLAELAREIGLGDALRLGEGEQRSGGAQRPSILADALEAVIGAVYLDGGFEAAKEVASALYGQRVRELDRGANAKDAKTTLQEMLQGRRLQRPTYSLDRVSGPAHAQHFAVRCEVPEAGLVTAGEGASRRAAEQHAAQAMVDLLQARAGGPRAQGATPRS